MALGVRSNGSFSMEYKRIQERSPLVYNTKRRSSSIIGLVSPVWGVCNNSPSFGTVVTEIRSIYLSLAEKHIEST